MLPSLISFCIVMSVGRAENICKITVPIGVWLQNHRGRCDVVKGHFILDETANNFTEEVFSTFWSLKRIEGCLYVKGFTGSTNLSFFSNLEEVDCQKKQGTGVEYSVFSFLQMPNPT